MKMLYLATEKVPKKWTRNYPNWDLVINELSIIFEDQLKKRLKRALDINHNAPKSMYIISLNWRLYTYKFF